MRWVVISGMLVILIAAMVIFVFPRTQDAPTDTATTTVPALEQSISDGTITLQYSTEFGLAVRPEQILVRPYIPPCDDSFSYCFYYIGTGFQGTNFETAGLRVAKRNELVTAQRCLTTLPEGYAGLTPHVATTSAYATSVIGPLGDAGAGHFAEGEVYRLFTSDSQCYEFETRIGTSQFANYEAGTIREFTDSDKSLVAAELRRMIDAVSIGGDNVVFPPAP